MKGYHQVLSDARALGGTLRYLGAGLIAGASDNDPTTVGTLAIIGASTGYHLTWLVLLLLPMLVTVQIVSTSLGAVTWQHFLGVIAACYGRRWAWVAALLVVSVCVITIGADLEGGAAALSLLTGRPWPWFVVPLALFVGGLLLFGSYTAVERALRYVLLIFIAYPVAALLAQPPWGAVLAASFQPAVEFSGAYLSAALALLGTTLTSYVYIWQTVEIKEERPPLAALPLLELDTAVGIVVTVAMFWFIVVATRATLGASGHRVQAAQDAAAALAPLAGPLAGAVFAIGLLGSALIALPVLAATTGYCVAATYACRLASVLARRRGPGASTQSCWAASPSARRSRCSGSTRCSCCSWPASSGDWARPCCSPCCYCWRARSV